ncbi:MAG: DUF5011 domain-containing protein [Bacilli bacterium]|nr:DUF5011 domain-containing protein [Bacilli bacterium]
MKKTKKAYASRLRNLVIIFALTAVIIGVSTYAWFVGMRTVSVSSFDVDIAGTESLLLSLDGSTFSETVTINGSNYSTAYTGNKNWWAGTGLIPMSSVGVINADSSRLELYEKASLTPSPGGYRLLASKVDNSTSEQNGYVAFDLFVKNFTGEDYIETLNQADEEAIYLTVDSEVKVSNAGVANTGIENSVRVAFAEIGRVIASEEDATKIQGIKCSDVATLPEGTPSGITGICRAAQVWEPNDTSHVVGAISWYETSCLNRTGADITTDASYTTNECGLVIDGLAYPTYAIKALIPSKSNVDVYDGAVYNGYTSATYLQSISYFTDTMKFLTSTERPTFITLAPNSITKIRVYIYIEGQDIDNYDFSSIGHQISVAFGFTKQRFTEDDINYTGPDVNKGKGPYLRDENGVIQTDGEGNPITIDIDYTAPRITLLGNAIDNVTVPTEPDVTYTDAGATAIDNVDGTLTDDIEAIGTVDLYVPGTYKITYKVRDAAGNLGIKTRSIVVTESTP